MVGFWAFEIVFSVCDKMMQFYNVCIVGKGRLVSVTRMCSLKLLICTEGAERPPPTDFMILNPTSRSNRTEMVNTQKEFLQVNTQGKIV